MATPTPKNIDYVMHWIQYYIYEYLFSSMRW